MYPGWKVEVDGEAGELHYADYLFRSVWVPEGAHQVEFFYQPLSFLVGAAVSLPMWILAIFLYFRWRDL
jgi:uncharacterized membrane protein YfhO